MALRLSAVSLALLSFQAAAADLDYLQGLLAATPAGGWVKASTNTFASSWAVTGQGGLPATSHTNPGTVVAAWSSFAWDSNSHNLLLWGGGHATYKGNEMYVWDGATGQWGRGSLPSRIEQYQNTGTWLVVDDAAPQSSHTYDSNIFLPVNNMFLTFGGASYNIGNGGFEVKDGNGGIKRAGPWMWDPLKADPSKVGGTAGSGYLASSEGGQMWINRQGQWTGTEPWSTFRGYITNVTAYREEAGQDVVYLSPQSGSTGYPGLFRYAIGDVRNGGLDSWEHVGVTSSAIAVSGTATIDTSHNLFVRTSPISGQEADLSVWDLTKNNAANPSANIDKAVQLVNEDGTQFSLTENFGMNFDTASGKIYLWSGDKGNLWETEADYDTNGNLLSVWTVKKLVSTTVAQPNGNFLNGVYGKWQYVEELGAFIALDEFKFSDNTGADVWLYKPFATQVPEPGKLEMALFGLLGLYIGVRRKNSAGA
jgi:hypothetical protein